MSPYARQPFQALRDFKNEMPVRTLSIHHRLRKGQAGRPSSNQTSSAIAGQGTHGIRAQDGNSFLIIREQSYYLY